MSKFLSLLVLIIFPITGASNPVMISHAGGLLAETPYTNSKESFQNSYLQGFDYLEVDLRRTSDGHTVLIHDWDNTWKKIFHQKSHNPTYEEFMSAQLIFTQLDLTEFLDEIRNYPNLKIILDIKDNVFLILEEISSLAPDLKTRLIPQVFTEEQSIYTKNLGFHHFLLALYRMDTIDIESLSSFFEEHHPLGFTVSQERVFSNEYAPLLNRYPTYVFTVNSEEKIKELKKFPFIKGIFTDRL
ncbi:MAG: glycerophosphodiester phosphodiesterase family protein [Oligoflexales bacterium]